MADGSTQSITIDASPQDVMAVIADFPAYPQWADSVKTCDVVDSYPDGQARQVHFVIDAGALRDDYVLEYDWADDGTRVDWRLVKGQLQRSQQGTYDLRSDGERTEVVYTLTVDLAIPMLGMMKRKAEKMIMDVALKELKRRVEGS